MSAEKSAFVSTISFYYRPPESLLYLLTLAQGGGVICVFHTAIPDHAACLISVIIACSYLVYLRDYIHARKNPVYIILQPDDVWLMVDRSQLTNSVSRVQLEPGAFVHPLLIVLRVNREGRRYSIILTQENTSDMILRRLRVRLRFPVS